MNHIKKTIWIIKFLLLMAVIYKVYDMCTTGDFSRLEASIVAVPLILASDILARFKVKVSPVIEIIYLVFLFISMILGSLFHFYEFVDYFDKFAHLLSGVVTAILAIIILKKWRITSRQQVAFDIIFMNILSLAIAGLWEIYEFIAGGILNSDLQRVTNSGVTDTMHDMIVALAGSLLVSAMYFAIIRHDKYRQLATSLMKTL